MPINSIEYRFEATTDVHIANNLTNEAIASRNGATGNVESNFETMDFSIFVDEANYDYHLASVIPQVVDAGISLTEAGDDYDCHGRTSDGAPDIGADEYNSDLTSMYLLKEEPDIEVFPNPATDMIKIDLNTTFRGSIYILFADPLGRIVYSETVNIEEDDTIPDIPISQFSPGIYQLVVSGEEFSISRMVTKL